MSFIPAQVWEAFGFGQDKPAIQAHDNEAVELLRSIDARLARLELHLESITDLGISEEEQ